MLIAVYFGVYGVQQKSVVEKNTVAVALKWRVLIGYQTGSCLATVADRERLVSMLDSFLVRSESIPHVAPA